MSDRIQFVPRRQIRARFREGWQLIPSYEYDYSDWAVLMALPTVAPRPSPDRLDRMMRPWISRDRVLSNRRAGSISGNPKRQEAFKARMDKRAAKLALEWAQV